MRKNTNKSTKSKKQDTIKSKKEEDQDNKSMVDDGMELQAKETTGANIGEVRDDMSNDYAQTEKNLQGSALVDPADQIFDKMSEGNALKEDDMGFKDETPQEDEKEPLTEHEAQIVKASWFGLIEEQGLEKVGEYVFKRIFENAPDALEVAPWKNDVPLYGSARFLDSAYVFMKGFGRAVNAVDDPEGFYNWARELGKRHKKRGIRLDHFPGGIAAVKTTLQHYLGARFTPELEKAWAKSFDIIAAPILEPYINDSNPGGLTDDEIKSIQSNWRKIEDEYGVDKVGIALFKNIFSIAPELLSMFPFSKEQNLYQSSAMRQHAVKVMRGIGRVVVQLENMDNIRPLLIRMGKAHANLGVLPDHYDALREIFVDTMEQTFKENFNNQMKREWSTLIKVCTDVMQKDNYEPDEEGNMTKIEESERNLISNAGGEMDYDKIQKVNEEKEKYLRIFRKEVDFHHKVAYRFEKAYRLGKKMKDRMALLNIDIVDLISDHSGYIESDPMALFYCLFFCIYYNNPDLVEFLRTMIYKMEGLEKIDRLLEYIDVNGLDRLRTVGEPINAIVYHMVFYQSVDDDLRICYSQILRQLRFVQLRDKDALHFLNQRDYELIRLSFTKNTTKINLLQFFPKTFPMKSSTYRKYNQAYYEEIVINNTVESRVAQNYRERFLVTAEDIYIVFEMYCKEDYDEQFQMTPKDEITHKQFVDLFIICLRNDSFKIAILIYTCYLNPSVDMDNKMMDILMSTMRESVMYHEHKLFYLHQHFDVLTIYQMNHLVDIYQEVLNVKDARQNPMINQYNTVKIALLIFRICWKIEVKQIYSLITKCSLLQSLLITSLSNYFERQNNILTLYKFMAEPILHMNEKKDSLDVMYEMNMQDLLKHPVVVEVLNLVYEGKYSVSSSSLSMSQTFQSLLEMPMFNIKSVTDRLIQNIVNFGDTGGSKQTSLQYNIWKQSIQQREQDEMLFTVLISATLIGLSIMITQILNTSFSYMKDFFGSSFGKRTNIFLLAEEEILEEFCPGQVQRFLDQKNLISILYLFILLNTIGMMTSLIQKITIFRNKDNVTLNYGQMAVEVSIVCVGIVFVILYNNTDNNTLISDMCSKVMDIDPATAQVIDHVFTMRNPREGEIDFTIIISVVIIQSSVISILMLQRTQYLGELIMMLDQMLNELGRFFATFGLIIGLFLLLGRMLGTELKSEHGSFFQVGLDLFDAFNGNQNFNDFIMPIGQTYIAVFMYLFKVLLISLLAAMFINKYKRIWQNLDAYRRFNIIKQKNSVAFDKYIGGVTLTFFPINILMLPLTLPILALRSPRASDFLLKIQYVIMMLLYCTIASVMIVPASPVLYIKMIANGLFIAATNKRQAFKGEAIIQLLVAILFGPVIIAISILVDLISLPSVLLKDSRDFERKYQMSSDRLNDKQINVVMVTFGKIFYGGNFEGYKGKHMTLIELMMMHRIIFSLIDNLHDLVCRGTKDYKESLSNVQDYNMTKILTRKASIPDKGGDYKEGRVELDVIFAVQMDIELYNYVDVVLRKLKMGKLLEELKLKQSGVEVPGLVRAGENAEVEADEEDDETKKVDGIQQIFMGPDGVPLKRNNSDVMNNFFVDYAVRSFTELEKELKEIKENGEKDRLNKFQNEIDKKKEVWKDITVGTFNEQAQLYDEFVKMDLDNSRKIRSQSSRGSVKSSYSKGKKSFKENDIKEKKTESTDNNSDDIMQRQQSGKSFSKKGSNVNSNQ